MPFALCRISVSYPGDSRGSPLAEWPLAGTAGQSLRERRLRCGRRKMILHLPNSRG